MFNPSRGGVRGGRDQFSWDSVKTDKYRENYLGHSLQAPVGRWQKGKDIQWYTRNPLQQKADGIQNEELVAIKKHEEEIRLEALGLKQKQRRINHAQLDSIEMKNLLTKSEMERDDKKDVDRVGGLGTGSGRKIAIGLSQLPKLDSAPEGLQASGATDVASREVNRDLSNTGARDNHDSPVPSSMEQSHQSQSHAKLQTEEEQPKKSKKHKHKDKKEKDKKDKKEKKEKDKDKDKKHKNKKTKKRSRSRSRSPIVQQPSKLRNKSKSRSRSLSSPSSSGSDGIKRHRRHDSPSPA